MKLAKLSQMSPTIKISQYDKLEKELNKLKFHLRMKRKIYDQDEYLNISDRIRSCEKYFKQEKSRMVSQEAEKILGRSAKIQNLGTQQMKEKIRLEKKRQLQNLTSRIDSTERGNYKAHFKTEGNTVQGSKITLSYQLEPISPYKQKQKHKIPHKEEKLQNIQEERLQNQRYISDFERKIKQTLVKIPYLQSLTDKFRRQPPERQKKPTASRKNSQIMKSKSLKMQRIDEQTQQSPSKYYRSVKPIISRSKQQAEAANHQHTHRYKHLKEHINRCKTELRGKNEEQIRRVSRQKLDDYQKSLRLDGLIKRYNDQTKNGDQKALDLMCMATLARANIVLSQI